MGNQINSYNSLKKRNKYKQILCIQKLEEKKCERYYTFKMLKKRNEHENMHDE